MVVEKVREIDLEEAPPHERESIQAAIAAGKEQAELQAFFPETSVAVPQIYALIDASHALAGQMDALACFRARVRVRIFNEMIKDLSPQALFNESAKVAFLFQVELAVNQHITHVPDPTASPENTRYAEAIASFVATEALLGRMCIEMCTRSHHKSWGDIQSLLTTMRDKLAPPQGT